MYEKQLCFFEYLQTLNPAQTLSISVLTTEAQVIYLKGLIAETQIVKYNEHGGGGQSRERIAVSLITAALFEIVKLHHILCTTLS